MSNDERRRAPLLWVGLVAVEVMIVAIVAVVIPSLVAARRARGIERTPYGPLKNVTQPQPQPIAAPDFDYSGLQELRDVQLVDDVLGSGTKSGYIFEANYRGGG